MNNLPIPRMSQDDRGVTYGTADNGTRCIIEEYETEVLDLLINDGYLNARDLIEAKLKGKEFTYERLKELLHIAHREDPAKAIVRGVIVRFLVMATSDYNARIRELIRELDSVAESLGSNTFGEQALDSWHCSMMVDVFKEAYGESFRIPVSINDFSAFCIKFPTTGFKMSTVRVAYNKMRNSEWIPSKAKYKELLPHAPDHKVTDVLNARLKEIPE